MVGGRQREFNKQEALNKAMHIFWKKGYVGASLSDLTSSMGINKPSLYAAFGNKEQLFVQATEYYIEHYAKPHLMYLMEDKKPLRERVRAYLQSILAGQCDDGGPKGCYVSLCVSEAAGESIPKEASTMIDFAQDFSERYLAQFFTEEITKKNLSAERRPAEIALFILTVLHGTAALARGGKTLEELEPMLNNALVSLDL